MAAYIIAAPKITDVAKFEEYRTTVAPMIAKYGGRYLTKAGSHVVFEKERAVWQPERVVIIEFPNMAALNARYRSQALNDPLRWGLIPYWCQDPKGGRKPISAKCETVHNLSTFRDAYRRRRCILPVDGFFEWKAIKGQKAKQSYAIAMKDGRPFGIGGLWQNWKDPTSGEWIRTFAIITTAANDLVAEIHDRMP